MHTFTTLAAAIGFAAMGALSAHAGEAMVGKLMIKDIRARATLPNAPVAGGFMTIVNNGSEPDRLVGGSAPFAGKVEVHEMTMENDVMRMREIEGGLEIPAGGSVELTPGGLHVMFMQLGERLQAGETRKATLSFEKAGDVEVEFDVVSQKELMGEGKMDHGKMGHGDMKMKKE